MATQDVNAKVAKLNVVYAVVREWQRGAITARDRDARIGATLSDGEMTWVADLYRTMPAEAVASRIAAALGI